MTPRRLVELEQCVDEVAREVGSMVLATEALAELVGHIRDAHPYPVVVHGADGRAEVNREAVVVLDVVLLRGIALHGHRSGRPLGVEELPWARAIRGERVEREVLRTPEPLGARARAWDATSTPLGGGAAITILREVTQLHARRAALAASRDALALEVAALGRVLATRDMTEDGR